MFKFDLETVKNFATEMMNEGKKEKVFGKQHTVAYNEGKEELTIHFHNGNKHVKKIVEHAGKAAEEYGLGLKGGWKMAKATPGMGLEFFFGNEEKETRPVAKPVSGKRRVSLPKTSSTFAEEEKTLELARYEKLAKEKSYRLLCNEIGKSLCGFAEWRAMGKMLNSIENVLFPIAEERVASFEDAMNNSEFDGDWEYLHEFRGWVVDEANKIIVSKYFSGKEFSRDALDLWKKGHEDEWYRLYIDTYFRMLEGGDEF